MSEVLPRQIDKRPSARLCYLAVRHDVEVLTPWAATVGVGVIAGRLEDYPTDARQWHEMSLVYDLP